MIRLTLAILLFIAAIVLFLVGRSYAKDETYAMYAKNLRLACYMTLGLGVFFLLISTIRVVEPGEVGIPVTLGKAQSPLDSGVAFVNPLASVKKLSIRTEDYTMVANAGEGNKTGDDSIEVQGRDGATGVADATVLYHLERSEASNVYRQIGTNFEEKIIRPIARSCIRDAFVKETMIDAATTARAEITHEIATCMESQFEDRGFVLESFQMRGVKVSAEVQKSINAKVSAEQAAKQAEFDLQRSRLTAEQKRVEAQGTSDAQQIIACGSTTVVNKDGSKSVLAKEGAACENNLTTEFLQYQYIQALRELVDSPNNSTLILPFDQQLLPTLPLPQKN